MRSEPVVILDYGVGNLSSIANMFKRLGADARITGDPEEVRQGARLVLPGVGAFDHGMASLEKSGLRQVLDEAVQSRGVPVLGICLGFQLMTRGSEEGTLAGLGWLRCETRRFRPAVAGATIRVPHMGWNTVIPRPGAELFAGLGDQPRFYFVHSYHVDGVDDDSLLCRTTHGYPFVSGVKERNIVGVQFHPEKSHRFGMTFLRNWLGQ